MDGILTIIVLLATFGLLVTVHEFGHFMAAKLSGVTVEQFAIGFGKVLFQRNWRGTDFSIRLFPFGGFVKLKGEDRSIASDSDRSEFHNQPWLNKVFILIAGVTMNLITACIIFVIYLGVTNNYTLSVVKLTDHNFIGAERTVSYFPVRVTGFQQNSGAETTQLNKDDLIVAVNDKYVQNRAEFSGLLEASKSQQVKLTLLNPHNYNLKDITVKTNSEGKLGISINFGDYPIYLIKYHSNIFAGALHAINMTTYQFPALASLVGKSVRESDISYAAQSVNGIAGVSAVVNDLVVAQAFDSLINLVALISISLATANLLPIPILDGGQIVLVTIESIRKKRFSNKFIEKLNLLSFAGLMLLTAAITLKDLVQFQIITNFINSIRSALGI